jgi:hypothetical protein
MLFQAVQQQLRGLEGLDREIVEYDRQIAVWGRYRDSMVAWEALFQRRPTNVVAVAMANKTVRTVWALLAHDRTYDRDYVSVRPA